MSMEIGDAAPPPEKKTRGSKACGACRKIKIKCTGWKEPPCERCTTNSIPCVFDLSKRGGRRPAKAKVGVATPGLSVGGASAGAREPALDTGSIEFDPYGHTSFGAGPLPSIVPPDHHLARLIDPGVLQTSPTSRVDQLPAHDSGHPLHSALSALSSLSSQPTFFQPQASSSGAPHQSIHALSTNPSVPRNHEGLAPMNVLGQEGARRVGEPVDSADTPSSTGSAEVVGIASEPYFQPHPHQNLLIRRNFLATNPAEIKSFVDAQVIGSLVTYYFDNLHPHFPLLSPTFHTTESITARSPLLLTAVCAVSARFAAPDSDVTRRISEVATRYTFEVASRGSKTLEMVQGMMLLTVWATDTTTRQQDDKTWLLHGMAKSIAQDLGLDKHHFLGPENSEDSLNRTRTWVFLYTRDQELSTQLGRVSSFPENAVLRSPDLYLTETCDSLACHVTELHRVLSRSLRSFEACRESTFTETATFDYMVATSDFESQLTAWKERHTVLGLRRLVGKGPGQPPQLLAAQVNFAYYYSLLIINSFGLKYAIDSEPLDIGYFFNRCYSSATAVLRCAKTEYAAPGWLQHAPDSVFLCISYAAVSLLRFCRSKLKAYHKYETTITELVDTTADMLEKTSISPSHVAQQYSTFLRALVHMHRQGTHATRPSSPRPPPMGSSMSDTAVDVEEPSGMGGAFEFGDLDAPGPWTELGAGSDFLSSMFWDDVLMPGFGPGGAE